MTTNQFPGSGFFPRSISWLTILLAVLTIGTFIAVSNPSYGPYYRGGGVMESSRGTMPPSSAGVPVTDASMPSPEGMKTSTIYYPYPYPSDVPVTDTRELLKVYYNATMRTRDTQGLTRHVVTTVRGYEGRIDQESISREYGYVSFSIPQSKYEAFRTEIEGLVGSRFLTVNISSQNYLPQKVSIEEQLKQATTALANYKTARQQIVATHQNIVQAIQTKLNESDITTNEKVALQQQLINENTSYATQLANADANIKYAQEWQKGIETQDKTLLANVATVTGTVSVQWISVWDMALLYLPGYWIPAIFAALTVLSYLRDRRRALL
jgi:hypothetical protein